MSTKSKEQVYTNNLRDTLKSIMQKEIEGLPGRLNTLSTKESLNIVLKLMPFVFPKVEAVHQTEGEPLTW